VFHAAVYRRCGYLRGVPLAVIAKWLGHANPAIAARIYAHSQDEALAAAASFDERRCSA
jgi:integrase